MRTTVLNAPLARTCTILSLLVCVRALPAANPAQPRRTVQNPVSAYTEGGLNDPCAVAQIVQDGLRGAQHSDSAVPLARLLSRTNSQAEPPHVGSDQGGSLTQRLWSTRVMSPEQGQEVEASLALKRLIRQVRSVKFEDRDTGPTFTSPAEPAPASETPEAQPAEMSTARPMGSASAAPAAAASGTGASLSDKTQKTLEMLRQNPNQAQDPLEIAELLFLSGRPAEAAPFYTKALDDISRTDPTCEADRAWVLFQLGNCLRETDTAKAQEAYMKLINEYPASPWTELAKAHGRLLAWYQKNQPPQTTRSPRL